MNAPMGDYTLTVTEKPNAAKRITHALDRQGKPKHLKKTVYLISSPKETESSLLFLPSDTSTLSFTKEENETIILSSISGGHRGT